MLVKSKHIKGLQVFSLKDSKKIGTTEDIVYDPESHRVRALTVSPRGAFTDTKLILMERIKSIGEDAVVIESDASIVAVTLASDVVQRVVRDHIFIANTKVITEDGVELGKVAEIFFDSDTGLVTEVELTQGPIKDVQTGKKKIRGEDIVSVGKDTTVVKADIDDKFAAKPGGLTGMMRQMQEKITDATKDAKS